MMTTHDAETIEAMVRYGGRFASAIGTAAKAATREQFSILKQSFPDLWKTYGKVAKIINKLEND